MNGLQWVARSFAVLAVLPVLAYYGARLHDGPIGLIPGGPLEAGEVVREPIADWSFARETGEIELQLDSQRQSRTVWFFVLDGYGYVPCSLSFPPGNVWHRQALVNGAAKLRIEGKVYPVTLSKLGDVIVEQMSDRARAELTRKYGDLPPTDKGVWLFQVTSHPPTVS